MARVSRVIQAGVACVVLICTGMVHGVDEGSSATDVVSPAIAAASVPEHESRPLGVPNGMLESGPSGAETASPLGELDPRNNDVVRVVLALAVVVVLLLGVRKLMRRAGGALGGGGRPSGILQVHARYPIARGQHLVLIQVGPRMLLVHQGGGSMRTLSEFNGDDMNDIRGRLESGGRGPQAFQRLLQDKQSDALGGDESELVDLTRNGTGLLRKILGGTRAA